MSEIKIVLGGGAALTKTPEAIPEKFKILEEFGVNTIDTAQVYGNSEELLGKNGAAERFIIDTKAPGGFRAGAMKPDVMISEARKSLEKLKTKQVDIFYFHAPDPSVPIADQLQAMNQIYKEGVFKRFGLSNYSAEEVQDIYDQCKANGYPLPSVYQGIYNPVARHIEKDLIPLFRKLDIAFYVYSPLAGGFLTKTKQDVENGVGRFDPTQRVSDMLKALYARPTLLEALGKWEEVANAEGCSKVELANRWTAYAQTMKPEAGDAIIVGAGSPEHLRQTIEGIKKGPLSEKAMKAIDEIWKSVENEAPENNYEYELIKSGKK